MSRLPKPVRFAIVGVLGLGPAASHAQILDGWSPDFGLSGVWGRQSYPRVEEVAVWNGDLYVAGRFEFAGSTIANSIARWDGERFHALGAGMPSLSSCEMTVHDDALVVAGSFVTGELIHIARWDGIGWTPYGHGFDNQVLAVAAHNGSLLAGGLFTNSGPDPVGRLARWVVDRWVPFAEITGSGIFAIGHWNGDLVVGGEFFAVDGVPCRRVARYDGTSWHALGDGIGQSVYALAEYDGDLVVGGSFSEADSLPAGRVARWDGSSWSQVGAGFGGGRVEELSNFDGRLYAAGSFARLDGLSYLAGWDGTSWSAVEPTVDSWTESLVAWNDRLVVGGRFQLVGDQRAGYVSTWADGAWQPLGGGFGIAGEVRAIEEFEGDVVFGGTFQWAGETAVANITRWNRVEHLPLGEGLSGTVEALRVHDGKLVAGGSFQSSGGQTLLRIAAWDGTSWEPMSGGLSGTVHVLEIVDGDLLAGGAFLLGAQGARVVRWTGSSWEPLVFGPSGPVLAIAKFGGELHVGGRFAFAGQALVSHIAAWTGSHWRPLVRGREHPVSSVLLHGPDLIVAGTSVVFQIPAQGFVSRWTGTGWAELPELPEPAARTLATYRGDLVAGGDSVHRLSNGAWTTLDGGTTSSGIQAIRQVGNDLFAGGGMWTAGPYASSGIARYVSLEPGHAPAPAGRPSARAEARTGLVVPAPYVPGREIEAPAGTQYLIVHDVRGRRVAVLQPVTEGPDASIFRWSGRTTGGGPAAPGVYFAKPPDDTPAAKVVLVR